MQKHAAVETKTTVLLRFQLAMNNTRVSVKRSKELDSVGRRRFITITEPSGYALETSLNSRKSMRFVYFVLLALAATVAFILWDRAPYRP